MESGHQQPFSRIFSQLSKYAKRRFANSCLRISPSDLTDVMVDDILNDTVQRVTGKIKIEYSALSKEERLLLVSGVRRELEKYQSDFFDEWGL